MIFDSRDFRFLSYCNHLENISKFLFAAQSFSAATALQGLRPYAACETGLLSDFCNISEHQIDLIPDL